MLANKQNVAILILTLVYFTIIFARPHEPSDKNSVMEKVKGCETNRKVEELCMRCAKVTKSNIVYPMCCSDEEDAYKWCKSYLNFGLH